jgi:hypothetical protein
MSRQLNYVSPISNYRPGRLVRTWVASNQPTSNVADCFELHPFWEAGKMIPITLAIRDVEYRRRTLDQRNKDSQLR